MEEADKVSSTAPDDGAPRDIIMNEAAAIAPTPADETQRSAEEDPPENTDLTTTEITSAPQITEITNLTTAEITSAPQMTEITNLTTPEITSAPQMTEITNVSAPQTTEETILPQRTEVTSAPQTEITSAAQMTEITNVTKAEITSAPQKAEETIIPQTTEVTAPQQTEVTSTAQMTEETINASAPQKSEESVTVTQIAEISSTWQITEETSPPEPAGDSFTPAAAAETPGAPSSCEPEPREESGSPREEEEETPPASHPEPENRTHASSEHREPSPSREPEPSAAAVAPALLQFSSVLELLYWRDVRASGLVFGCSLFFLLSLLSYSIISVLSYSTLALLTLTLLFRTYRGVLQAVQKSDEGHPFKRYLDQDVALSKDMVQRHSDVVLRRINGAVKELRRLFLVEDMIDSLKFAVFLWVLTHVGAWFNGLTLLILGLIGAFSGPIVYERHQAQIDQFILTLKSRVKDGMGQIQAKVPGAKKKSE
ncbi:reticulon-4b isoform X2 [Carassius auratus]|uniref:Reticulon n=1 Tax=Carassius auratus TaxID=7957 RepID=A0A6P6L7H0_CARAU|nr:reticulon-4-like isoform X2 [Carassius auratus]